ncbi:MAG: FkbM family methyltransferase [Paracoccaceae bacterium]
MSELPGSSKEDSTSPLLILKEILPLDRPIHIVDIGAAKSNAERPYQKLLEAGLCRVTGFDPQEGTLDQLIDQSEQSETYLPYAIGDGRPKELHLYRGTGLTSFLQIRKATLSYLRGLRRAATPTGVIEFETTRLDELTELADADFIKIDIQGAEILALEHAKRHLANAVGVQTEVSFYPIYEDQPSFGEIDVFLRENEFMFHSFLHFIKRLVLSTWRGAVPPTSATQMLDGDALYLRDFSQPEALSSDQIKRTALIAQGCYEAPDLALRCLDILEQRKIIARGDAQRYASALESG